MDCVETVDSVTIETFVGIPYGEDFIFESLADDGTSELLDISGWEFEIVVTSGPVEAPGSEVHRFTEADGEITRDDDESKFSLAMSQDTAELLAPDRYSFRALLFNTGEDEPFDLPFRGTFNHRRSGE